MRKSKRQRHHPSEGGQSKGPASPPIEDGDVAGPYNPTSESTNSERVIAAIWECLRRNEKFRSVATQWLASADFRFAHAATVDYHNPQVHTQRCALDWMLTSAERIRLAEVQIAKFRWWTDHRFNFGPIQCDSNPALRARSRKELQTLLQPTPLPNPPQPITVEQSWSQVPEQFKAQFRFAHFSQQQFGELNQRLEEISKIVREMPAKLLGADAPKHLPQIADTLGRIGLELNELAQRNKIFVIPWSRYSNNRFQQMLDTVKASFSRAKMLVPTKRYDRHSSYLGTTEDWRWFLKAEHQRLNIQKSADLRTLATQYSEDLRQRAIQGKAPRRAKPHGFTGEKVPGTAVKNRRRTVARHVRSIQNWIALAYPPELDVPAVSPKSRVF